MQVQEELEKEAQEDSDQEGGYFESDPKFDELNSNDTVTSKSTKNMKFNKMKSQQEIDDEFIHQQTDQYQKKMGDTATSNSFDWDDPDMNSNLRRALKDINPDGVKKQSQKLQFEESYPPKATPLTSFWKNIKERMGKQNQGEYTTVCIGTYMLYIRDQHIMKDVGYNASSNVIFYYMVHGGIIYEQSSCEPTHIVYHIYIMYVMYIKQTLCT